ncbi:protein DYAD-like [Coffea eugenioides]|uniref:Protein AMEIOTIC 1-like isoform X1 n=2 Tax=Coffea arabica TaxID=13443 RepID=A0ABM4WRT9_COFAR|nr:protein DYAD-like isoform X1 [Coffea arabica]XP_027110799.1 protein DYAD-like isoform X1 [Coffea arabica]XP_027162300.1 protein DYAD-like [Coffea eugenioides]XP_027162301.1 protein DYAD-like [Coffea eugenioides]
MVPTTRGRATKLNVAVGGFYKILHANLPPRTPPWLRSVSIAMVSEKSKLKVTISFPSKESIESCLDQERPGSNPKLDMCFIMGLKLAQRVLFREVKIPHFGNLEEVKDFWLVRAPLIPKLELEEVSVKSPCSSSTTTMKFGGGRLEEKVEEVEKQVIKVENVVKAEIVSEEATTEDLHKAKKYKWWSNESFEAGKRVILNILKEKEAAAENPIYRAALRKEAQKEIGNTGLLDHLLKDIPGKIAPDGTSRFQRCYNADGVIMYWLESADLVDVRKKAGVADPFWIPPPGWKQGACSAGCPCAKEVELLREELSKVKRDLEETQKQLNEVCAGDMRRYCDCNNWVGGFW